MSPRRRSSSTPPQCRWSFASASSATSFISAEAGMARTRIALLIGGFIAAIALAFVIYPDGYPQDIRYHRFADTRSWAGIPNTLNVVSNVGFPAVAAASVLKRAWTPATPAGGPVFIGVFLTSIGSPYYPLAPGNRGLPWDPPRQ